MEGHASKQALQLGTRAEALANAAIMLTPLGGLPASPPPPLPLISPPPPGTAMAGRVTQAARTISVLINPHIPNPGAVLGTCGQLWPLAKVCARTAVSTGSSSAAQQKQPVVAACMATDSLAPLHSTSAMLASPADPSLYRCTGSRVPAGSGPEISAPAIRIPNTNQVGIKGQAVPWRLMGVQE